MPEDKALIVGIDRYPRAGVDPLSGAVADARLFYSWVTSATGGNVPIGNAKKLESPPLLPGAAPVASPIGPDVETFFYDLIDAHVADQGGRLYIFLSGHGISPAGQESVRNAALLMANAIQPDHWFCFPANNWAEGIRGRALFREVVLIMDCCRDLKTNAIVTQHPFGEPIQDSKNCLLFEAYATQWASKARELELPPDNTKRGVFTHSVLGVLNAGRMNGEMFKASVKAHLTRTLADEKKPQQTEIKASPGESLGSIIFNANAADPRTDVSISGLNAPPEIKFWPEGADDSVPVQTGDWQQQNGIWQGQLAPGDYYLKLANADKRLRVLAGVPTELSVA